MRLAALIALMAMAFGCAHAISRETREKVSEGMTARELFKDPSAHMGKTVMLGGVIVNSTNASEGTYIEVLEMRLGYLGRPEVYEEDSRGRFLVLHEGYLDTAIYSPGRRLTVAGVVLGKRLKPLGRIEYSYPLIESREIHLFKGRPGPSFHFGIGVLHSF
jgi:outer membrane lipoprotein